MNLDNLASFIQPCPWLTILFSQFVVGSIVAACLYLLVMSILQCCGVTHLSVQEFGVIAVGDNRGTGMMAAEAAAEKFAFGRIVLSTMANSGRHQQMSLKYGVDIIALLQCAQHARSVDILYAAK